MDIKIGKYKLTSDDRQFIVCHLYKPKKGKNKGKVTEIDHTYHPRLADAFENILKRGVLASKAKTLETLLMFLRKQKADLQLIFDDTIKREEKKNG